MKLLGIDSVLCPTAIRDEAWRRLASDLPASVLDSLTTVEPLSRVPQLAEDILARRTTGRVVLDTAS